MFAGLGIVFGAASAIAQGSVGAFSGVVHDSSGAVLPGVTVEASSDALIEKVRSVVSDGQGQYKIIDLRPGTYVLTFSLPGFRPCVAKASLSRAEQRFPITRR
jgi:hypothetical protein